MLPRAHILLGTIFSLIVYLVFPSIGLVGFLIILFSSFLIDVDHYLVYVYNSGKLSLKKSLKWHTEVRKIELIMHKRGKREKGFFHILHTIEFHVLLAVLSLFHIYFFYVFIGFIFHSLTDFFDLARNDFIYRRNYSLILWLVR